MHPNPYVNCKRQVVSPNYLTAMLAQMSGVCHRYTIEKVSENFCHVAYSNPDEYGTECPVHAMFPLYRVGPGCGPYLIHIVLDIYRVYGGRDEQDRDSMAETVMHMLDETPELARDLDGEWYKAEDVRARKDARRAQIMQEDKEAFGRGETTDGFDTVEQS